LLLRYSFDTWSEKQYVKELKELRSLGMDGICFPMIKREIRIRRGATRFDYYPLSRMIEMARDFYLKTGLIVESFHSAELSLLENFSPPVGANGIGYIREENYAPVCPNDPMGIMRYHRILQKLANIESPDYVYFENLRFPYYWLKEELDIQNQVPPFCYCPFCTAEFSSVMGEIVTSIDQIIDMLPEWLEWRTAAIMDHLLDARDTLPSTTRIIVSLPPLLPIDVPFTTGQLPMAIIEEDCHISPKLHHLSKGKSELWVEDMLDQYQIDIKASKIIPSFETSNLNELTNFARWEDIFPEIIVTNRTNLSRS